MRPIRVISPSQSADGEIGEVAEFGGRDLRPALAALAFSVFDTSSNLRRPDDLAGEPRAPIDARDRRALGRGLHVEVGEARSFDPALRAEERLVERIARKRARRAAEDRAGRPEDRTERAPGNAENERCHLRLSRRERTASQPDGGPLRAKRTINASLATHQAGGG